MKYAEKYGVSRASKTENKCFAKRQYPAVILPFAGVKLFCQESVGLTVTGCIWYLIIM